MPFHVAHTGPAPLSTYFIVKPVQQPNSESIVSDGVPSFLQRAKTHFTTAFRGRKLHGLSVDLPHGYSGIVLKPEELQSEKGAAGAPPKRLALANNERRKSRRSTRSSTRASIDNVDGGGNVPMEQETLDGDEGVIQTLCPTAKFSNFTLWNADVDVDEGRDEYLRTLSEYQHLLAEVHLIYSARDTSIVLNIAAGSSNQSVTYGDTCTVRHC